MQEIEQIYTQYRQDVYRYLCSLTRDAALAEDLLSETFLRALTGLSGFRKGACVRTWLFSIARMLGSTGCGANGMYFPAMSFWPGMWRRAARARLRLKRRWTPGRWPRGQRNCCKRAARPPERCFGCGRRDIRSRRSHRGAASAKARPARWIFARATGCGSNCRRRGQSYENTNRARDTL